MKKILIAVAVFIGSTAYAQKFEFGPKAGVNISNFTNTSSWQNVSNNALVGYHVGGFISFFIGDHFAIQPEVLYSTQGIKYKDANTAKDLHLNYINIPVLLKYRTTSGFYVEAGPQIGFRTFQTEQPINNLAKSSDLSLAAGIGYQSKIGLGIGARYTAGLSKVGDFQASNGINPDYKNGVVQFSIFYSLFNKRK